MSANAVNPSKILLTTDFSENASCAYPYAVGLAGRHNSELIILHVITGHSEYLEDNELLRSYEQMIHEKVSARLKSLEVSRKNDISVRREIVSEWSAKDGIIAFAKTEQPDLIVMSTQGHGLMAQIILGSAARGVIGAAPCPVLCVKCSESGMLDDEKDEIRIARIMVPVDLSEDSRAALKLASEYAKAYDAQLHLMYVVHVDVPEALYSDDLQQLFELDENLHTRITRQLKEFHSEADPDVEKVVTIVEKGSPAKQIAQYADSHAMDLIIISRKGFGKTPHALGCVAGRLLHEAHCPTLVI